MNLNQDQNNEETNNTRKAKFWRNEIVRNQLKRKINTSLMEQLFRNNQWKIHNAWICSNNSNRIFSKKSFLAGLEYFN